MEEVAQIRAAEEVVRRAKAAYELALVNVERARAVLHKAEQDLARSLVALMELRSDA